MPDHETRRQAPAYRIFMATGCYIQGPGCLDLLGEKAASLGRRVALIGDAEVLRLVGERLRASLDKSGLATAELSFSGETTAPAIDALAERARGHAPEVVVGAGGGRALDAAKGVARRLGRPFVSVPTIASTDAPASRGLVVYDDEHRPVVVEQLVRNPEFVIVDTAVIAQAPARFLRAGIGDAIAKKFEAEACWAGGGLTKHGTRPLRTALMIADACYQLLRAHGAEAVRAVERGQVTDDLEYTVEAALLLSAMAFENGGLSVTHAMAAALGTLAATRDAAHGEHVAYGTLVQVELEGRPEDEIEDLAGFLGEVGLPRALAELGLAGAGRADIDALAAACVAAPYAHHQPRPVDAAGIAAAIERVERRAAARPRAGQGRLARAR
jgi:glycerol dehydrogenase